MILIKYIVHNKMVTVVKTPTSTAYGELQQAFDHFNQELFNRELPTCLITLQRNKHSMGYFSNSRFVNIKGEYTDEIAMNPSFFAVLPIAENLATLAHEMCHLWQYHLGKPSRGRYHNLEWADKMEAIGLMASDTGHPGGKKTGQCMSDYPIEGGQFLKSCEVLLTRNFKISWMGRFAESFTPSGIAIPAPSNLESLGVIMQGNTENRSNRIKYTHDCLNEDRAVNVWGKPELNINCGDCGLSYTPS